MSPINRAGPPAKDSIRVRVLFFAQIAELTGCRQREFSVRGGTTAGELFRQIAIVYPGVGQLKSSLRLALNCQFIGDDQPLGDGDEFALIPPVSGGSNAAG